VNGPYDSYFSKISLRPCDFWGGFDSRSSPSLSTYLRKKRKEKRVGLTIMDGEREIERRVTLYTYSITALGAASPGLIF
jgi:hypothetical protein